MKPLSYFAVASQQVAQHSVEIIKLEATINANATVGLYLQIHDNNSLPAEGVVPKKVWPASEAGYKEFKRGELVLAVGCYVCLSTTAATKTLAVGGSDLMDILEVELQRAELLAGSTIMGDTTTARDSLAVWTDADAAIGKLRLTHIRVKNNSGNTQYLMLLCSSTAANGDTPYRQWKLTTGQTRNLYFGEGLIPNQLLSGINKQGCYLMGSTTAGILTATADTSWNIKADKFGG